MTSNTQKAAITAKDTKENFGTRGWILIIFGIILLFMTGSIQNDSLNALIPKLVEIHGWSSGAIARISSYATLFGALMIIPMGALTRRFGPKRMMVCAMAIISVGVICYGQATTITAYAIAVFCTVAGTCSTMNYLISVLATNWFPTKKGLAMGYITIGNNLGTIAITWLLSALWGALGFSAGTAVYGLLMLIPMVILIFCLKDFPEDMGLRPDNDATMTREQADHLLEEAKRYDATSPWTMGRLIRTPQVWKVGLYLGFMGTCIGGVLSHIVPIFTTRGYTSIQAQLAMSIAGVAAIPLSVLLGKLDAKRGSRIAGLSLSVSCVVCFFLAAVPARWSAVFAALAGAGVMGCLNNMASSLPASIFGRYDLKRAQTCILPLLFILQAVGVGMTGTISEMTGNFTLVMCIMGVCSIIATLLLATLKDECIGRVDA